MLCQCIADGCALEKLIVASSMSIYGEGCTWMGDTLPLRPGGRPNSRAGRWNCTRRKAKSFADATTEEKSRTGQHLCPEQYDQERMCLITGRLTACRR